MFKRLKIALIIGLAFFMSVMLANYLDGRRVTFESLIFTIESNAVEALAVVKASVNEFIMSDDGKVVGIITQPNGGDCIASSATWPLVAAGDSCRDWSTGDVEPKLINGIYTWIDEEGTPHFSNIKPKNMTAKQHDFKGLVSVDYFTLSVTGDALPKNFSDQLRGRINRVFSFYSDLIEHKNLSKTALNLRFFRSKKAFNNYRKLTGSALTNNVIGFYSGVNNQSSILYRNSAHAMATAVHESSHAINRSIIGLTNRWLNEGLAEYLEDIDVILQLGTIKPAASWAKRGTALLPLRRVFSATGNDWSGALRSQLYQTSSAFVFYMMDDSARKARFANYIKAEQVSLCDVLSTTNLLRSLGVSQKQLQRNFSAWLTHAELKEHLI